MKAINITAVLLFNTAASLFAQGLVNFYNDPSTPVYVQGPTPGGDLSIMSGPRDSFYFGLLLYDIHLGSVTFTGVYGTNTGVNGLFSGGTVAVPGWTPGTTTNFFIAGWSADLGHDYKRFVSRQYTDSERLWLGVCRRHFGQWKHHTAAGSRGPPQECTALFAEQPGA